MVFPLRHCLLRLQLVLFLLRRLWVPHRAADGPEVLPPAEFARVRGDNCGGFQVGEIHILRALSSRPELENWRCKVLDWDQSAGRVGVEVEDGGGTIRVKPEVLRKSVFVNDFRGVSAS